MTREDAERICRAYGWTVDPECPIEEGYWPLVRGWNDTDEPICLPSQILAALDPVSDRIVRGAIRFGLADDDDSARELMAQIWELGAKSDDEYETEIVEADAEIERRSAPE